MASTANALSEGGRDGVVHFGIGKISYKCAENININYLVWFLSSLEGDAVASRKCI